MSICNPEKNLTIEKVKKELVTLESTYKVRRKTLRALLAVLDAEQGFREEGDDTERIEEEV